MKIKNARLVTGEEDDVIQQLREEGFVKSKGIDGGEYERGGDLAFLRFTSWVFGDRAKWTIFYYA